MITIKSKTDLEIADEIEKLTSIAPEERDEAWILLSNTLMSEWFYRRGNIYPPCYKNISMPECYTGPEISIIAREELLH